MQTDIKYRVSRLEGDTGRPQAKHGYHALRGNEKHSKRNKCPPVNGRLVFQFNVAKTKIQQLTRRTTKNIITQQKYLT